MTTTETTICGKTIQHDNSGVGHNWRKVSAANIPADDRTEIEGEIIDGGCETCNLLVTSGGNRYRWAS